MKRIIIALVLSLTLLSVFSQRYLPGQQGIHFNAGGINGFKKDAFYLGFGLSRYTPKADRWIFAAEYLQKKLPYNDIKIPVAQFTGEGGYYLNFLSDRSKIFFFSVGVSALAGYEVVNRNKKILHDGAAIENRDKFICGGAIGFEIETFFADRVVFLVNLRERILPASTVNRYHFQLGFGLKLIIN